MMSAKLQIFDPPMCCASGACGPSVDPKLTQLLSDIQWLAQKGVTVERYNLSGNPGMFVQVEAIKNTLQAEGNGCLPIVMVDGEIVHKGGYPARDRLAEYCRITMDGTMPGQPAAAEETSCDCSGCGCTEARPGSAKAKVATSLIIVLAIAGILIYKGTRPSAVQPAKTAGFAVPSNVEQPPHKKSAASADSAAEKVVETKTAAAVQVGEFLESLTDLNKVAINQDAVFVFIPNKKNDAAPAQTHDAVSAAQNTLKGNKIKIGLYTLSTQSPQYADIAKQVKAPAILVAAKGRGMSTVSGEVTEAKLIQAYAATTRSGCGPSGCGPSGCN